MMVLGAPLGAPMMELIWNDPTMFLHLRFQATEYSFGPSSRMDRPAVSPRWSCPVPPLHLQHHQKSATIMLMSHSRPNSDERAELFRLEREKTTRLERDSSSFF